MLDTGEVDIKTMFVIMELRSSRSRQVDIYRTVGKALERDTITL